MHYIGWGKRCAARRLLRPASSRAAAAPARPLLRHGLLTGGCRFSAACRRLHREDGWVHGSRVRPRMVSPTPTSAAASFSATRSSWSCPPNSSFLPFALG